MTVNYKQIMIFQQMNATVVDPGNTFCGIGCIFTKQKLSYSIKYSIHVAHKKKYECTGTSSFEWKRCPDGDNVQIG